MPKAGYSQLSYYQRRYMKEMLDQGYKIDYIAMKLKVARGTVYNELKRGTVDGAYDPEYSEERARENAQKNGKRSIIANDQRLAEYISRLILEEHLSPDMIVSHFKTGQHEFQEFPSSATTIYKAIDDGLIPNVGKEQLNYNDIAKVISNRIELPKYLRANSSIQNGNKYKVQCRKNGDILLKRIKG